MQTYKCNRCGKIIVHPNRGPLFCSRKCLSEYHHVTLVCDECGGEFKRRLSDLRGEIKNPHGNQESKGVFCSKHCSGVYAGKHYGFVAHPKNSMPYAFLNPEIQTKATAKRCEKAKRTNDALVKMFNDGLSLDEVMEQLNVTRETLYDRRYRMKKAGYIFLEYKGGRQSTRANTSKHALTSKSDRVNP